LSTVAHPSGVDKDTILRETSKYLDSSYRVSEYRIQAIQAVIDGPNVARTQARVRIVPEAMDAPIVTWWRMDWRQDGGQWRVTGIEPLSPLWIAPPNR
jgi:hypothetical protein